MTPPLRLHFFPCSIHFSFRCHLTDHPTGKAAIWRAISPWMTKNAPYILLVVVPCLCRKQLCRFIRRSPGMALGEIRRSGCCLRPHGTRQRTLRDHSETPWEHWDITERTFRNTLRTRREHSEITEKTLREVAALPSGDQMQDTATTDYTSMNFSFLVMCLYYTLVVHWFSSSAVQTYIGAS